MVALAIVAVAPGVESALIWGPARPGHNTWVTFPAREGAPPTDARLMTWRHTISPGALSAIGTPLQRGREFTERDTIATPLVAVVSATLARSLSPGEDPLGKRLRWNVENPASALLTVVGVAADAKHRGRVHDLLTPIQSLSNYRDMTPFVLAAVALLVLSRRRVMTSSREEA